MRAESGGYMIFQQFNPKLNRFSKVFNKKTLKTFLFFVLSWGTMSAEIKHTDVAIIGAGLAGLTSAYRLQQAGIDASLYEARDRVGGRVFSIRIGNTIAELGGQSISDGGNAPTLRALLDEFSLELEHRLLSIDCAYRTEKGLLFFSELLQNKPFSKEILIEAAKGCSTMQEVLDTLFEKDDPLYAIVEKRLQTYEGGPVDQLSLFYLDTLYYIVNGGLASAHSNKTASNFTAELSPIKGGNSRLPEKIAEQLGNTVHLEKVLQKISRSETNTILLTFTDEEIVSASKVILALPCSVFQHIAIEDNAIPQQVISTINSIKYGDIGKFLVPIKKQKNHAIENELNQHGVSLLDEEAGILTFFCSGKLSHFTPETIQLSYELTMPEIASTSLSIAYPTSSEKNSGPIGYSWISDPFSRGSYSYIAAGQERILTPIIDVDGIPVRKCFQPIRNQIYFAGEHTTVDLDSLGTMEAACESGERTAQLIIQSHKNP